MQQWAYQWTTLYKRDLRFSGYDAADNAGFSLLHERIKLVLSPVTCNKSLCVYQYTVL